MERVYPQVNKALSDHGPFCSHSKHPEITGLGKEEHRENMEEMAKAVIECLKCVTFGGQYLTVLRGIPDDQWVFNKEDNVRTFLELSKCNKKLSEFTYSANDNSLLQSLCDIWNVKKDFKGSFYEDYTQIRNDENVLKTSCVINILQLYIEDMESGNPRTQNDSIINHYLIISDG